MIKEIVKDTQELSKICHSINIRDRKGNIVVRNIIEDLIDTATEHSETCIGLAANQIGYNYRVIVISDGRDNWLPMINPIIKSRSTKKHSSEEGCLSLEGMRTVTRHDKVEVMYQTLKGTVKTLKLSGRNADVVQHEMDHLNGILI